MEYPGSLSEFAYQGIKKRIMAGMYDHGYRFTVNALSEELGISPTPVKEALNQLVQENFLVSIPRRGYKLKHLFLKDVMDMMHTRRVIEAGVAPEIVRNAPRHPETLKKMESLMETSVRMAADPNTADAIEPLRELETSFHCLYVSLAENNLLNKIYAEMWASGNLYYLFSLTQYPVSLSRGGFTSHEELYEAILKGDVAELAAKATNHLDGSINMVLEISAAKAKYGIII